MAIPWLGFEIDGKAMRVRLKAEKEENWLPLLFRCASASTGDLLSGKEILQCLCYLDFRSGWDLVHSPGVIGKWRLGPRLAGCQVSEAEGFRGNVTWRREASSSAPERADQYSNRCCFARHPRLRDLEERALAEAMRVAATLYRDSARKRGRGATPGSVLRREGGGEEATPRVRIGRNCGSWAAS